MRQPRALTALWGLVCVAQVGCATEEAVPAADPQPRMLRLLEPGPPPLWGGDGAEPVPYSPARSEWRSLGPVLGPCLGEPLQDPPAEDPGAWRKLVWDSPPRWRLELSGQNLCGLSGTLELQTDADRVAHLDLRVDGLSWAQGGRELAERRLQRWRRQSAEALWRRYDEARRILLLHDLSEDPDEEAAQALRDLAQAHPDQRADIEAALSRRR